MRIEDIDKNFKIPQFDQFDIEWFDVRCAPFKLYGLIDTGERFLRMPCSVASSVSSGVEQLNNHTAGGRVRFATDSPFIALVAKQPDFSIMAHMTILGLTGFDIYCDEGPDKGYFGSIVPDFCNKKVNGIVNSAGRRFKSGMHTYTVNFPLYCSVSSVYIGVKKGSVVKEGMEYRNDKFPIVYYGSSITQGGCASRPGMCYQNIICRENNINYVNLGFSGSAKGECAMAEYIAGLDMCAFVYDYDYNAPTSQHLEDTHRAFFDTVRDKHPFIPIIIVSKPCAKIEDFDNLKRLDIIRDTYNYAVSKGDENVYFIDGCKMMSGPFADDCFVDYCHPTDLGFARMAQSIGDVLKQAGL